MSANTPAAPAQIAPLPQPPTLADPENFDSRGDEFLGAIPGFQSQANALAQNVSHNAGVAHQAAQTSTGAAVTATQQADAAMGYRNTAQNSAGVATAARDDAAASALQASKLNLGPKPAPPTTDNQGQALLAGATYYDTTLGKWRVWTGTAWGDGISTIAGVSSLNGQTGEVLLSAQDVGAVPEVSFLARIQAAALSFS